MSAFPTTPVTPREFIEEVVPALFAEVELDERAETLEVKLGVRLEGPGGGDWTLHFVEGELGVAEGLSVDCGLTLLQSVDDWSSALWGGHPQLIADAVERFRQVADGPPIAEVVASGRPANPEALRELENLPGRIDAVIEAGDSQDAPDWSASLQIGPGPIAEAPNATLRIGAAEAEALRRGELHPLEALITGQLRLEGDLGMILQLQAIAMSASLPPPAR